MQSIWGDLHEHDWNVQRIGSNFLKGTEASRERAFITCVKSNSFSPM